MYLYKQKRANGETYLAIKEKYYVSGKGSRERTIESLGILSELEKTMDDPIAYYTQYAAELTEYPLIRTPGRSSMAKSFCSMRH